MARHDMGNVVRLRYAHPMDLITEIRKQNPYATQAEIGARFARAVTTRHKYLIDECLSGWLQHTLRKCAAEGNTFASQDLARTKRKRRAIKVKVERSKPRTRTITVPVTKG